MADDLEGNVLHTSKPRQKKHSERKKGSSRAKKDEKERLKEIETSIRSQLATEERSHNIVERLVLEDSITEDFLINSGNFITTSHYADVVEERMLSKKCGYPLCSNPLNQIPAQKYKISVRSNRVYDITERKCFCSNFCYKASKYFESQISDSPVWTRIGESLKTLVLLESGSSSSSDEIKDNCITSDTGSGKRLYGVTLGDSPELSQEKDPQITSPDDSFYYSKDDPQNNLSLLLSSSFLTHRHEQSLEKSDELPDRLPDKPDQLTDKQDQLHNEPDQSLRRLADSGESQLSLFAFKSKRILDNEKKSLSSDMIIQSVQAVFQEWCTHSTMEYLGLSLRPEAASVLPEAKENDSFMTRALQFFQPPMNDSEDSDSDLETGTSPKLAQENIVITEKKTLHQDPVCILPPIDSKSQVTIRRRIVLDKLFRTMPDLLSEIKLTVGEISRDVTELVHTFSLSSNNITLKPFQWKIIALGLILILQRNNSHIAQALESCEKDFDALLARLEMTRQDIELVLSPLFEAQHWRHSNSAVSKNEAVKTFESKEKENKVDFKERENYGDMEELD